MRLKLKSNGVYLKSSMKLYQYYSFPSLSSSLSTAQTLLVSTSRALKSTTCFNNQQTFIPISKFHNTSIFHSSTTSPSSSSVSSDPQQQLSSIHQKLHPKSTPSFAASPGKATTSVPHPSSQTSLAQPLPKPQIIYVDSGEKKAIDATKTLTSLYDYYHLNVPENTEQLNHFLQDWPNKQSFDHVDIVFQALGTWPKLQPDTLTVELLIDCLEHAQPSSEQQESIMGHSALAIYNMSYYNLVEISYELADKLGKLADRFDQKEKKRLLKQITKYVRLGLTTPQVDPSKPDSTETIDVIDFNNVIYDLQYIYHPYHTEYLNAFIKDFMKTGTYSEMEVIVNAAAMWCQYHKVQANMTTFELLIRPIEKPTLFTTKLDAEERERIIRGIYEFAKDCTNEGLEIPQEYLLRLTIELNS